MVNMDVENQLVPPPPNGSASEQEREPGIPSDPSWGRRERRKERRTRVHFKTIKQRSLPFYRKHKKTIIIFVFSHLIFSAIFFGLGILVPLNSQKDAIKCPPDWIGHQGHCYKFSVEEKTWKDSQNVCISHTASLAKITDEEKAFVKKLAGRDVFWIGLKREPNQPWKWLDGENSTLEVMGNGGDCAFWNDDRNPNSGTCITKHRYICKKN